jgi:hypothetical protein
MSIEMRQPGHVFTLYRVRDAKVVARQTTLMLLVSLKNSKGALRGVGEHESGCGKTDKVRSEREEREGTSNAHVSVTVISTLRSRARLTVA